MYQLIIKPRAIAMMQEAYRWYEDRKTGLGEDFLNAANIVFSKLAEHPE